jgi:hypothetical protein
VVAIQYLLRAAPISNVQTMEAIYLGPILYQVLHPWHWLTYGSNATAVGVAISALGLVVVILYTLYTRHLMMLAWQTRRGELYPLIVLESEERRDGHIEVVLSNLGGGSLINSFQWHQPVSESFSLNPVFLEHTAGVERLVVGSLVPNRRRTLRTPIQSVGGSRLLVLEGTDAMGGRHQFCFVSRFIRLGVYEITVQMIHPEESRSLGAIVFSKFWTFWTKHVARYARA